MAALLLQTESQKLMVVLCRDCHRTLHCTSRGGVFLCTGKQALLSGTLAALRPLLSAYHRHRCCTIRQASRRRYLNGALEEVVRVTVPRSGSTAPTHYTLSLLERIHDYW